MDASNKQPTVAEKFAAVWEKKNAKAARAGGVSLMALSLAACGGSSSTTTTTPTDTTTDTTTPVTPTVDAAKTLNATDGADNLVGGSGDDTIYGLSAATAEASTDTLGAADIIDGGAGADTLIVTNTATNTGALGESIVSNVEVFNIRQTDASPGVSTFDASLVAGETAVNSYLSAGTVTVTKAAAGVTIGHIGNGTMTTGALNAGWAATVKEGTVNIMDGTSGGAVTTSGTVLATNTVNSTGDDNTIGALTLGAAVTTLNIDAATDLTTGAVTNTGAAALTTINITGAGAVDIDAAALQSTVKTIDASGNSGGVDVDMGSLATATLTGSSGDDKITAGAVLTTGSVDAGDGTDTLVVDDATFVATAALGAKYTNFETLTVSGISQDVSLVDGITKVNVAAATSKAVTGMNATQAANVYVTGDQTTAATFALKTATGTSDVLTLNLGSGSKATASTDLNTSLVVTGFETLNLNTNQGPDATTANSVSTIGAITGATLANINLTGGGFTINDAATTLKTTIDGSELTGVLTLGGNLIAGSSVIGGAGADVFTAGTNNGVSYSGGAGKDKLTATVAQLVASGSNDTSFDGGAGDDTLVVSTAAPTLTDNHFTNISDIEVLTLSGTGAISLTSGAAFNSAVNGAVTITDGVTATTNTVTYALGLANDDITITHSGGSQTGATTEDINITTGSGDDTVTVSATNWVGVAGAAGELNVSTGAGDDTISVTTGTLLAVTGVAPTVITAGTGADSITTSQVNAASGLTVTFVMAAGDSVATAAGHDTITGFDAATGALASDTLDFSGTAAIGTVSTHADFGTIASSTTTAGVTQFDDAAGYSTALVISDTNLADVVGYLNANTAVEDTIAFAFDSTGDGSNDSTMVYHNETATDTLVLLASVTGVDALITTNGTGANDVFIA
jgi:hypothetical protein